MNKYDNFFSKLTLVTFVGGSMGSFLINFLTAEDEKNYDILKQKNIFGILPNHEWSVMYYFDCFEQIKKEVIEEIKAYYGETEYIGPMLFAYAKLINNCFYDRSESKYTYMDSFTLERVKELNKTDFDIKFPYVKNHVQPVEIYRSLPYKNKIFCYFPPDKKWIANCFTTYKHHLYKLFQNNDAYDHGPVIPSFKTQFSPPTLTQLPDHHSVNMYELVFNKNFEDLEKIYPNFTPNKTQLELLEQAHTTSHLVLKDLNLSHEMVTEDQYNHRDFLDNSGMSKLIKDYAEYYNHKK